MDEATGEVLKGVGELVIYMRPNKLIEAHINVIAPSLETKARGFFKALHPITGQYQEIEKIVFADGTEFSADA